MIDCINSYILGIDSSSNSKDHTIWKTHFIIPSSSTFIFDYKNELNRRIDECADLYDSVSINIHESANFDNHLFVEVSSLDKELTERCTRYLRFETDKI